MDEHRRESEQHTAKAAGLADIRIEQIRKLAEMREEGILTDEEFTATKRQLLSHL